MIQEIQIDNYEIDDEIYTRQFNFNKQDIEFQMRCVLLK